MADFPRLSRCTLFICLLASVALHAMLLLWLPGWRSPPPVQAVAPVLDVVMVVADTADVVASAAPRPRMRNVPSPPAVKSQADSLPPARSEPVAAAVPVLSAPSPPVEDAPAHGISPPPPAMAAQTPAPAAPAPVTVTPPAFTAAYLRNPPPVYPAAARRGGEEGTVMLRVLVGRDGAPLKVELDQSSRSRMLDHAALDAVKGWRFVPARRGAENIEDWVRVPVSFRLES
ncbi:MAG: energy transducer TonB [Burkholderiales bacterium]|nr:energy transducer TonB [Burkholderiales bacterium]